MDGLILDTEAIYSACNIEVAPDFGLDGYDLDKYREFVFFYFLFIISFPCLFLI